jgi:hypothetical protein
MCIECYAAQCREFGWDIPAFFKSKEQFESDFGTRGYMIDENGKKMEPVWSRKPNPLLNID